MAVQLEEHPNPEIRWKNRRRMAWCCVWGMLMYPVLVGVLESAHLADMALPFYASCGLVISVYIGGVAHESIKILQSR